MNFRIIFYAILAVVACLLIGFVAGFFMPGEWKAQQSVVIAAPPERVMPWIESPGRWPDWFPWNASKDPSIRYTTSGPAAGPGAVLEWTSEKLAHGLVTIETSDPAAGVTYRVEFQGFEHPVRGRLAIEPQGNATVVHWTEGGELGRNPIARLFRALTEANLALEFQGALERLKGLAEKPGAAPAR